VRGLPREAEVKELAIGLRPLGRKLNKESRQLLLFLRLHIPIAVRDALLKIGMTEGRSQSLERLGELVAKV
jgi:hypothetical protein